MVRINIKHHRGCWLNGCGCMGCGTVPLIMGILVVLAITIGGVL